MRARLLAGLVLTLALALAACEGDGEGDDQSGGEEQPGEDGEVEEFDEGDLEDAFAPPEPVDLDEGTAALVDGTSIDDESVERRVTTVLDHPEMVAQLEEADSEEVAAAEQQIRTEILSYLITQQVIRDGAADLGVDPGDDEVQEVEREVTEEVGGEEALDGLFAQQGVGPEDRDDELRFIALLEGLQDAIVEEEGEADTEETPEGADPGEVALQNWYVERMQATDVQVDQDYGVWVAETGQIMPVNPAG
jgi:hypothetical protein